ncbi:MAG TPA: RHS repeat-associated core domain-containing protein [Candidatus Limnocylindria bacterium]
MVFVDVGRVSTYTYQASGLVATLAYPNGMSATYTYDRAQRLTRVANAVGPLAITTHAYTLDAEGNRTALDEFVSGIDLPPLQWSPSVQVNDVATSQQDRPAIALGRDAATYLVWDDYRSGSNGDIYFSRRDPTTAAWSANRRVNDDATGRTQWRPSIAIDGSNDAYAAWQDDRDGNRSPDTNIYFSKRTASTGTWSANVRVNDDTRGSATQSEPKIAVTADGAAVAVWSDFRSNQWNVYSARLTAGGSTWSANIRVTDNTSSRKWTPDLVVGPDGTAYAVWEDDRGGNSDVWFAKLPAGASAWTANQKLSDDPGTAAQYDPHVAIDAAGDLIVVYLDDRAPGTHVRSTRLLAGTSTWEPSRTASDAAAIPVALALGVRADGNAFAAWQDARGTSYDIWGADYTFATNSWSASSLVSDDPASSAQMRPAAALSTSEVAVAWRDDRVAGGDIRERRRTAQQGSSGTFAYTYDGLNRLASVVGAVPETFSFDAASNVATRTGPAAAYTYDGANRLTSDGIRAFTWDGADRLVQRGADTFGYDPLARLTSSTIAGTARTYAYNGDGLLSLKTEGASTTAFLWDPSLAPAALMTAGTDRVVHGLGPLYVARSDGTTLTLARDGLGSVRAEVGDLGLVSRSFRYAAYGEIAQASLLGATPTLLGYAGELRDGSGLIYLRARWYDPGAGRFMSADSYGGAAAVPASLSLYGYAAGAPSRHVDPTGHCLCFVPIAGAVIGGVIGAGVYLGTHQGAVTPGGLAGAVATGAITGAVASIAPLAGGSIAIGAFGASSTGLLATGIAAGLNFTAGTVGAATGWATANAVTSAFGGAADWTPTPGNWLITGAASAVGGWAGSAASPMVGVYLLRQLRFAPHSIISQGPNMSRLLGSAFFGSLLASGIDALLRPTSPAPPDYFSNTTISPVGGGK